MSLHKPTVEQLDEVLDIIHDIAVKAAGQDKIPLAVEEALDRIVSLSRYTFNVLNAKRE